MFPKKSIGLDVSDHTIEVVELQRGGNKMKVLKINRVKIEPGIIEHGRVKNSEKLILILRALFKQARPKSIFINKIAFALPKSQTHIKVLEVKSTTEKDLISVVEEEAIKVIPLNKEDLVFSYKLLNKTKESVEVLLVAASKKIILEWQDVFNKLGVNIDFFDIEVLASFRGLTELPEKPFCIVDIGAFSTNISIFNSFGLRYSYSINIAGNSFNKELMNSLGINKEHAEGQKIKFGLSDKNNPVFPVLINVLENISNEIKNSIKFFEEKTNKRVKNIILIGGSSKLKEIDKYFSSSLGLNVILGKSVLYKSNLASEYIGAIGVALRGLDKKWDRDPYLDLEKKEIIKKKKLEVDEAINKEFVVKKKNNKSIILIVILIIILIGIYFWYMDSKKVDKQEEIKIEQEEQLNEIIEQEPIIEMIVIKETETGWLNVRKGPGIDYEILMKIYPGEEYELLGQDKDWYNIKIEDKDGWIFGDYIIKK
ncbi:type IV pilus assembly protein PilM [Patescibacteria group bacterium]|nr:type IV pilus assembly protein PilM [Patescibacteria group bacterium]